MMSSSSRIVGRGGLLPAFRSFHSSARLSMKVLVALYADPKAGYPPRYAREEIPNVGLQDCPTDPWAQSHFRPGELLGCVSGELGLRKWLEGKGHQLVVVQDKDGPGCEFEKHLPDTDIVISQPFWPAYMTKERFAMAKKLKMCLTAGIGSDHYDLEEACKRNVTVAEITGSNVVSVAEHVVMMMLALVRNYIPSYLIAASGGWDIADCVQRSYDLEGMHVGIVAAGRIGRHVLRRIRPFGVKMHYYDKHRLSPEMEKELDVVYHPSVEDMVKVCDVISINVALHPETEHMFNDALISKMKRGAYIVNTARGKICDRDAIVRGLQSGQLGGYAGDVWFPQPAPRDHPWRTMPFNGMTPHISGASIAGQSRYVAGVFEVLECFFEGKPLRTDYLICQGGQMAGVGATSYTKGDATGGSAEAAKFK